MWGGGGGRKVPCIGLKLSFGKTGLLTPRPIYFLGIKETVVVATSRYTELSSFEISRENYIFVLPEMGTAPGEKHVFRVGFGEIILHSHSD